MRVKTLRKIGTISLAAMMSLSYLGTSTTNILANDGNQNVSAYEVDSNGYNVLGAVASMVQDQNEVTFNIATGERIRFTFLENNVFRMYMAPEGAEFQEYPTPNSKDHTATITNKTDDQYETEYNVVPVVTQDDASYCITTDKVKIMIAKETSLMKVMKSDGSIVWEEAAPLKYKNGSTIQTLKTNENEYFYGGGTQNGRFSHKGQIINIVKEGNWVDKGVASPSPFYWSTDGYGVLRNTWKPGAYDFGKTDNGVISTTHDEKRFDAYYFIDDKPVDILGDYYELTGSPVELPEYASYLGHLNCYNRDYWLEVPQGTNGAVKLGDKWYKESKTDNGGQLETLLGAGNTTAEQIIRDHKANDMPLGWFLPNDGYGCGYGQADTQAGDLENLKQFSDLAIANGVQTGLWTQSNLWPADASNPQKGERDIYKEVEAGVHSVKTDVAWVGPGYSFAMNGISVAYDAIATKSGLKPNIVTLNGWAGTQRYGGIWTGDQYGGQWEYIRFHIPTYIGTSLSGQPNIGSDMDGIFGGAKPIIWTRDFQWKAFTTYMLDMDGWGSNQKSPWALGENGTSINRTYLKLKAQLTPYGNTISHEATALNGLPMIRAMFLEEENDYTLGSATQYQYMYGDNFLVAPIYQETAADAQGNDIRNDIYLPSTSDVWFDYFTGEQYRGGQVLNNFDAPLWKLPLFVKNGSIIPMYSENNNPEPISDENKDGLDRSQRIVEFYPSGDTEFNAYEDDGKTLGGASATTLLTSSVDDQNNATLTANRTIGSYTGMVKERSNEFIVNVSKEPSAITGTVAGEDVTFKKVTTQEEYDHATGNVYFYNEHPSVLVKKYASQGSDYASTDETARPKVYVKSTEKVDITSNDFTVVVEGFENTQDLGIDELNENLAAPTGLAEVAKTDSHITIGWDSVEAATTYDVEADGIVYRNIKATDYTHFGLSYLTDHDYRIRSVNYDGYSKWSDLITIKTADNPYRNVPQGMTATTEDGNIPDAYAGEFENMFDEDNKTEYSSAAGGAWKNKAVIIDMKKAYEMDKLEYICRQNMANGAVKKFTLEYSNDGVSWTTYGELVNDVKNSQIVENNEDGRQFIHYFDGSFRARYLKLNITDSTGFFLQAYALRPYIVDGSIGKIPGDVNNSGGIEDNDLMFYENYMGITPIDADYQYVTQAVIGDIDNSGLIDAYDISYVARQLGDPVDDKAAKGVDGKIELVPSKTDIKAGDVFTVDVYGIGLKNVNAFSVEIPVDTDLFSTTAASNSINSMFMRNLSLERIHTGGKTDNYVSFVNIGKQTLINGTGSLAKVSVTAKADFTWDTKATHAILVGQDLSSVDGLIDYTQKPVAPETINILSANDISEVTFSNEVNDKIDPSTLWQQTNWKSILFDGNTSTILAEFKWITDATLATYPEEIMLPMDMNFKFKEAQPLTKVKVYNRSKGSNGAVNSIKATGYIGDTAVDLGSFSAHQEVFEFKVPENVADKIDRVVLTPETSSGTATGIASGSEKNRMLSLYEVEFITDSTVYATDIRFTSDSSDHVTINSLAQLKAVVNPGNASNPFYNIESSDPSIAKVIKVPTETAYYYAIQGVSAGSVTLTATTEGTDKNGNKLTATMEFNVIDGVDSTALDAQIKTFDDLYSNLYTQASYDRVKTVVEQAKELKEKEDVTQAEIDKITIELATAIKNLELKGSNDQQPSSVNLIDQSGMARFDESSMSASEQEHAGYVIDGDSNTIWHSNYNTGYTLPQYVTIDLGEVYKLEQVNMLPRQNSGNGHITHYRIEVSTDEGKDKTFIPVVEGFLSNDGKTLDDPGIDKEIKFDATSARFVRFIALESLGGTKNAYASIAELNFFGKLDLPTLEEALATAERYISKEDTYTTSSYAEFYASYETALALVDNEEASENEISTAIVALRKSARELKVRASEWIMTQLANDVETYAALKDQYTEEEFAAMAAALKTAEDLLAKDPADVSQTEAGKADMAILTEATNLNNYATPEALLENLQLVIDLAEDALANEADNVRPGQIAALKAAIEEGQALIDEPSTDRLVIKASIEAISKATMELWEIVDKAALQDLVDLGEALTGNYTESSKAELAAALQQAKAALDDDATEAQVKEAYARLAKAINNVKPIANKEALNEQIAIADKVLANPDNYISSTLAGLKELVADAKALAADENASQKAIDAMTDKLTKANLKVRTKADKTALEEAIAEAKGMDLSSYTATSATALKNTIANAEKVMANEAATKAEVEMSLKAIRAAIDNLEKLSDGKNPDDHNNQNVKPGGNGNAGNGTTGSNKVPSNGNATGDHTNAGVLFGLLVLSGFAVTMIARKKKEQ